MRSTQHGRARGNGKRVNQTCHFGIMGGLAPLQGVPLAHRSYIMKHATTHLTIPPELQSRTPLDAWDVIPIGNTYFLKILWGQDV